ncbi:alpha/beta hydrolase [Salinicola aestuarinus]|uniref:alpha/beta hydrolase n=1 Tax=Salinicola aestuarinus TaxID=1949082 RepID=UPI00130073F2|nr:alpha/beta hydrolase-fold protein [Salinicola aestuarinus]
MTLPDTAEWTMPAASGARDYLVQVSVPDAPPPPGGYPVLYVLDGNARFPLAVTGRDALTLRGPFDGTAPWLIVGVGYPQTRRFDGDARSEDYTPALPGGATTDARGRPIGGARAFLDFLTRRLIPEIEHRYDVDDRRRALLGHSYGGLFALYAALTEPARFSDIIAISPSLWWGDGELYRLAAPAGGDATNVRVLLGVGGLERARRPAFAEVAGDDDTPRMCDNVVCFADWLDEHRPGWQIEHRTFAQADHGSVMWPAMQAVWAFLDPPEERDSPRRRGRQTPAGPQDTDLRQDGDEQQKGTVTGR